MEIIIRQAEPGDFEAIGEVAVVAYRTIDPDLVLLSRPAMKAAHAIYVRLGFERAPELDETWDDVTLLGFALRLS